MIYWRDGKNAIPSGWRVYFKGVFLRQQSVTSADATTQGPGFGVGSNLNNNGIGVLSTMTNTGVGQVGQIQLGFGVGSTITNDGIGKKSSITNTGIGKVGKI